MRAGLCALGVSCSSSCAERPGLPLFHLCTCSSQTGGSPLRAVLSWRDLPQGWAPCCHLPSWMLFSFTGAEALLGSRPGLTLLEAGLPAPWPVGGPRCPPPGNLRMTLIGAPPAGLPTPSDEDQRFPAPASWRCHGLWWALSAALPPRGHSLGGGPADCPQSATVPAALLRRVHSPSLGRIPKASSYRMANLSSLMNSFHLGSGKKVCVGDGM